MELLLFLSAILSALTGAISGRAPETAVHHASQAVSGAVTCEARVARTQVATDRPVHAGFATLTSIARVTPLPTFEAVRFRANVIPLYGDMLRE